MVVQFFDMFFIEVGVRDKGTRFAGRIFYCLESTHKGEYSLLSVILNLFADNLFIVATARTFTPRLKGTCHTILILYS
jgi:hypothetical protein